MIKTVSLARMSRNTKTGTIPSASSRYLLRCNEKSSGDGVATSPSVNVMNSQGEWQFSSQGQTRRPSSRRVYASETDSTTYRVLDEDNL